MHNQVIQGVCIGVALALCVAILIYLVRKDPKRAKKILFSFIRTQTTGFHEKPKK